MCLTHFRIRLISEHHYLGEHHQIWHEFSISGMFTDAECRGHTNFVISKMYEGYFQLIYN